jgi:hypothetical protein
MRISNYDSICTRSSFTGYERTEEVKGIGCVLLSVWIEFSSSRVVVDELTLESTVDYGTYKAVLVYLHSTVFSSVFLTHDNIFSALHFLMISLPRF